MGTIICQECERTIEHVDDFKVSTLYSTCSACKDKTNKKK
ncbi:GapA-binding peptide SR1P [Pullulanibacillus sp. KACC 23026]|nr:GapA-binding peptide SR1P [Pullulanibacillus sp. KACC 23026]WEG11720.1 GapA-binding peptide SR1P [Pullulanibacillus sp. KACC 23026]